MLKINPYFNQSPQNKFVIFTKKRLSNIKIVSKIGLKVSKGLKSYKYRKKWFGGPGLECFDPKANRKIIYDFVNGLFMVGGPF